MGSITRIRRAKVLLALAFAAVVASVAVGSWLFGTPRDRRMRFTVRDASSSSRVWDLTATLQGRVLRGFYQGDGGAVALEFTRLKRGESVLELSAPSYLPVRVPVTVRGRMTVLEEPIRMTGFEIPGLSDFLVFVSPQTDAYAAELRPVRSDGTAIANHPCLDLRVGCLVSVQTRGGAPATAPTDAGAGRGRLLFRDRVRWEWDGRADALFRYHARIPRSRVLAVEAPYLVFDFLIVAPDPRRISPEETDVLMDKVWAAADTRDAMALLEARHDQVRWFLDTAWNVERAP